MSIGITMIGASGAGKTCYLYAMYSQMALGVNNFSFVPTDYDQGMDLEDAWDEILDGQWPAGNDKSFDYEFSCCYSFRELMPFSWHDYRGGIITNQRGDDFRVFLDKMESSSALLICVSAEDIKGLLAGSNESRRVFRGIGKLLPQYRAAKNNQTVPIAITITKADLLAEGEFSRAIALLKDTLLSALFVDGENWFVCFVGVSLGEELGGQQGGIVSGKIDPVNIHLPVMFAVYHTLNAIIEESKNEVHSLSSRVSDAESYLSIENRKNGWNRFWDGDYRDSYRSDIESLSMEKSELQKRIGSMQRDLEKISSELSDGQCVFYFNGEEMEV